MAHKRMLTLHTCAGWQEYTPDPTGQYPNDHSWLSTAMPPWNTPPMPMECVTLFILITKLDLSSLEVVTGWGGAHACQRAASTMHVVW